MISENYVTIQGWMAEGLNLKGNELIAYAFIYGFTQDGRPKKISYSYLAKWLQSSRQTAIACVAGLEKKGYVRKSQRGRPGQKENYYQAQGWDGLVKKLDQGAGQENIPGLVKKLDQGAGQENIPGKSYNDLDDTDTITEGRDGTRASWREAQAIIKAGKEFFGKGR
jgi:hypothetical protein